VRIVSHMLKGDNMATRKAKKIVARLESDLGPGWVLRGLVVYPSEGDTYTVAGRDVDYVLSEFVGREVVLLILPVSESEAWKICPTCGLPYPGAGCPACADDGL